MNTRPTLWPRNPPKRQTPAHRMKAATGMALIEALVASAILGIGLIGATRLTLHALQTASETRQYSVAHALAVDAMECHQSGRADCVLLASTRVQGTTYTVQSQGQPRAGLALVDWQVRVQWPALTRIASGLNGTAGAAGASGALGQQTVELVLHSSGDQVPAWVGVSSP